MSRGNYNLGATRGIGSSTRMFYFCKEHNPQPWNCIDQFIHVTPAANSIPKPGKMKAVFLLELTAGFTENDLSVNNTLNYYWNTYPQEFIKCPIVDTQGSSSITLQLLDEYYGYGFRNFVGFSRSTILNDVLSWFNTHYDATGISTTSTAASLNVPKNIFRMTANDHYLVDSISSNLVGKTVNYIYESSEYAATDLISYIQNISGITACNLYPIQNNTDLNALSFFNSGHSGEVMVCYLITNRQYYLDLFVNTTAVLTYSNTQYDILGIATPVITNSTPLINNYNTTSFKGIETSILWRNGYYSLTSSDFSIVTPNILNLLNQLSNNLIVDNINSHFGPLIFNPSTKDINYFSFLIENYNGTTFVNSNLYIKDPYLGEYTADFITNTPVSTAIIPVSQNKQFYGKALGLFNLGYISQLDNVIYQSLYYYWYSDSSLPKFPTVDITDLTSLQVADLLTSYYNQGYRLFLGPNYGFTLATTDVLNWFSSHPDTICINLLSGVTIPNCPLNIYRLTSQAENIISLLISKLQASQKIYFIYDNGDPVGISVNYILQSFCTSTSKPYKSFAIDSTHSNLTVTNMLDFFGIGSSDPDNTPVTSNDTNVILSNSNLQNYLNLYTDVSMNQVLCPQYIASGQVDPTVPTEGTILNNNLYLLDLTYPSTSYLWNKNRLFLTDKYSSNTDSVQLLNALKMMKYILAGKDIKLLGSHSGTLQFDPATNNIMFPSVLIQQYQSTPNTFVNYEINFTDPLLGIFTASFI